MKRTRNDLNQFFDLEAGEGDSEEEQDDGDDGTFARILLYESFSNGFIQRLGRAYYGHPTYASDARRRYDGRKLGSR